MQPRRLAVKRIFVWAIPAVVCMMTLVSAAPVRAQDDEKPKKENKKEAKMREKERAQSERNARRYEKLKTFAVNLYGSDIDFRDEVDEHFDVVQRAHSERAFHNNIAEPARPTVVHDGDRLRLQEGLYDNKMVADYINRVGQSLVPADSDRLFAFRLMMSPIPSAETLSTGTIYISTGLVSLLDNEAQLSYVLAHEMAHVQLDHWKLKSMLLLGADDFERKEGAKRRLLGLGIGALAGAAVGGISGAGAERTVGMSATGAAIGLSIASMFNNALHLDWDTVQENEADAVALKAIGSRRYDVRQVRQLYVNLQQAVKRDQRVGLGFISSRRRTAERLANTDDMINQMPPADSAGGAPIVTNPEFVRVMSTLKRDNGIVSFYYDMFQLAKSNLEYAIEHRKNDPSAHYYYGKVMKLVGRTEDDKKRADEAFALALKYDLRERNYGAHFYRALAKIDQKNTVLNPEIAKHLQDYVIASIRFASEEAALANALPANLDDMYDYMAEAGDVTWQPIIPDSLRIALSELARFNHKEIAVPTATTGPAPTPTTSKSPVVGKTPSRAPKVTPVPVKQPARTAPVGTAPAGLP
jgi:hypothetical protein